MNLKNEYYQDENGNNKYNELCEECPYDCKQSFKSQICNCKYIQEKRIKK